MLSDVMEDYLKAIYYLEQEDGAPVGTSRIAEYLDVTSPTVTSMIESLADRGLVEREKYKGVELTDEGETVAVEVVRHHRLLEAYLTEHLDYDWSEVHDEADALEHHISEEFERRVAEALGDPEVDPHGDPIPSADLTPPDEGAGTRLSEHTAGDRVRVERVSDRDADELAYLQDAGIAPGTVIEVTDVAPFGMVTVAVGGDEQSLPETVARSIRVTVAADGDDRLVEEA
ncbi:metal-dependent transcriptional regulator [Halostella sp. JP-L12]|uniref:metal-dependent transcriptional regulator n=1 Tax=Halostella TaxID=1843185 RepID=UPI000EF815A9|nr:MULTISPECIES: metal-dependent transcriptional regulator [Halostella]NHN47597.1 metal-dependent transcriptional regulator [Halostella sp. JP-L12]